MAVNTTKFPVRGASSQSATTRKSSGRNSQRHPSDDEILGLVTAVARPTGVMDEENSSVGSDAADAQAPGAAADQTAASSAGEGNVSAANSGPAESAQAPAELAPILEANPQLRQAWDSAQQYQQIFATPTAARDAQQQLTDLDSMFFSARPADHAALAARIHELSPEAFHGLAHAMQAHAAKVAVGTTGNPAAVSASPVGGDAQPAIGSAAGSDASAVAPPAPAAPAPTDLPAKASVPAAVQPAADPRRAAQAAFFHDTNAAAVEQVLGAIHSQVDHLLPESVPAGTRNRIVGEIYRELDATLRANRQLGKQLREAFQAGAGDSAHQRAIVTMVTGRARQALPAVAKRVIGEWTQTIVAANRERLGRHEAASKRVDISGAGPSDGVNRKPMSSRDINYRKLSDADILNL
ncbi:MAG TPA: hypothetical protein VGT03_06870 [Candidatus Acidoferrales bacterium]|nr:hypothetical protein [Candidatus Acidoferrales bacterium]